MKTVTATTFDVSDVVAADRPLPEVSYKQAVEALLTIGVPEEDRRTIDRLSQRGYSLELPRAPAFRPVEACSRYHGRLVADVAYHPVVAAVHLAFMDHRPLVLSPDIIWLMICQAVANHLNAHAEELRPRFVLHRGRIQIDVIRNDFVKGSPENPWPEVFAGFSTKIREHVGPGLDLFRPDFSTTGPVERAAAEIVLLDAMQSYFQYVLHTRCGIPTITVEGTTEDWQAVADRAEGFADCGLGAWIEVLRPILRQFVSATQGHVEASFWRSIYKLNDQSGGPVITGWITAFFPYLKDVRSSQANIPIGKLLDSGGRNIDQILYPGKSSDREFVHGPTIEKFPGGLSKAPFLWKYYDKTIEMEFLGGFVGVAQDPETSTLRPEIGWAVREAELSA